MKHPSETTKSPLTNIQKIKLIEETLQREIKPALEKDGGGIELIDVDGNPLRCNCAAHVPPAVLLR